MCNNICMLLHKFMVLIVFYRGVLKHKGFQLLCDMFSLNFLLAQAWLRPGPPGPGPGLRPTSPGLCLQAQAQPQGPLPGRTRLVLRPSWPCRPKLGPGTPTLQLRLKLRPRPEGLEPRAQAPDRRAQSLAQGPGPGRRHRPQGLRERKEVRVTYPQMKINNN